MAEFCVRAPLTPTISFNIRIYKCIFRFVLYSVHRYPTDIRKSDNGPAQVPGISDWNIPNNLPHKSSSDLRNVHLSDLPGGPELTIQDPAGRSDVPSHPGRRRYPISL